ncbi:hypothetical protein J7F03_20690 [Streptomyces sp. ISL-43]|uniref:hypothetical protein n=1 Tax=Streptomyces sp. ISL-43 TaxID=2819183 RepID=UPI001BEC3B9B|nr:hypothetical protein [Streptomyces sp. ISL-43]MBT2449461.1 hypothetical protein [Streptomyces sp. ISL-43]
MADETEIIVHPVSPKGGRKVTAHVHGVDADLGRAFDPLDVSEFLRRAGLEDVDLSDDGPIRWEGGGPEVWTSGPPA